MHTICPFQASKIVPCIYVVGRWNHHREGDGLRPRAEDQCFRSHCYVYARCKLNASLVFGVDRSHICDCSGKNCWLFEVRDSYGWEVYVQNRRLFGGANYWMFSELEDIRVIVTHGTKIMHIILCIHVINQARIGRAVWVHNSTSKIEGVGKLWWFSLCKNWSSRLMGSQSCVVKRWKQFKKVA